MISQNHDSSMADKIVRPEVPVGMMVVASGRLHDAWQHLLRFSESCGRLCVVGPSKVIRVVAVEGSILVQKVHLRSPADHPSWLTSTWIESNSLGNSDTSYKYRNATFFLHASKDISSPTNSIPSWGAPGWTRQSLVPSAFPGTRWEGHRGLPALHFYGRPASASTNGGGIWRLVYCGL